MKTEERGLKNFSVLKGTIEEIIPTQQYSKYVHENFIVKSNNDDQLYLIHIDIGSVHEPTSKYFEVENFEKTKAWIDHISNIKTESYTNLNNEPQLNRPDYIRENILTPDQIRDKSPLPPNELSNQLLLRLKLHEKVWVFGDYYDNNVHLLKSSLNHLYEIHSNLPKIGLHEIHSNQGTPENMKQKLSNGIYQDGCILIFNNDNTITGLFFCFTTQCYSIDDHGNCSN